MNHTAYGLRAEYVENYLGGVLAVDGEDFDVKAELEAGDGVIVVDDTNTTLILTLDEYPALKRVPVPAGRAGIGPYDRMTADQMRAELRGRDLPVDGRKPDLKARLEAADAGPRDLGELTVDELAGILDNNDDALELPGMYDVAGTVAELRARGTTDEAALAALADRNIDPEA